MQLSCMYDDIWRSDLMHGADTVGVSRWHVCFGQGICRYRPIVWGLLVSLRSYLVCTALVNRWFVYDL